MPRVIAIFIATLCLLHVAMTALYLAPASIAKQAFGGTAELYMAPLFRQNWHLFSPDPGIASDNLWLRCDSNTTADVGWVDPFASIRQRHYANRLTGRGKLLYLYNGMSKKLKEAYEEVKSSCKNGSIILADGTSSTCDDATLAQISSKTPAYKVAHRFASDFCLAQGHEADEIASVQVKIMTFYPKQFSERSDHSKKWSAVAELVFPELSLTPTKS